MSEPREGGFTRLDNRLGRIWSRIGGTIFLLIGLGALFSGLSQDNFSIAGYWPVLGFAALMFLLSRLCFKSKAGLLETLSETPDRPSRKKRG